MVMSKFFSIPALAGIVLFFLPQPGFAAEVDGVTVVEQCYYKYWGEDQRANLEFTMRNKAGRVTKRRTYVRFWKDYRGEGDLVSKMMLFTTGPPEYIGNNLLRITYTLASKKPPELWIFIKKLQSVSRLSVREEDNLDWGLNSEDLTIRQINEDTHSLLGVEEKADHLVYKVESVPTVENSYYGRIVSFFEKRESWDDCALSRREYYDKKGRLIKKAAFSWQKVGDAWVNKSIVITIERNNDKKFPEKKKLHKDTDIIVVTYRFTEPHVNVGLKDRDFSQRSLRRRVR